MPKTRQPFRFKQFDVHQNNCAMKVGTDGVLLGAWARTENVDSILDIGTGTGLLSLMLAQRSQANITAIEVDEKAASQAKSNFENSPWSNRLNLISKPLQDFTSENSFDLIVSNPPYFASSEASTSREIARNQKSLPLEYLMERVSQLLNQSGKCCLILPFEQLELLEKLCLLHQLFINKLVKVKGSASRPVKRMLLEISFSKNRTQEETLVIEPEKRHKYSQDYISLMKDYLLIF